MKIAIYHPWIYVKSGLERTIMEIKRRSRHDWSIYTGYYDAEGTYPELKQMDVKELKPVSVKRRYSEVIKSGMAISRTTITDPGVDAIMVSCDGLGSFINFANKDIPSVCLCFTPLRAVYDPEYRKRLLSTSRGKRLLQVTAETAYRYIDRRAWRYYRHVFCISNEVKQRVLSAGLCDPSMIEVTYPGIDGADRIISDRREPFFFLPGRIMWTKNIELAVRAFQLFKSKSNGDFSLKIAGMVDEKSRVYFDRLKELVGDDPSIEFILDPTDAVMKDYYRRCYAVLFAAFNEDLGITPMEAGTVAKPAIAVNRGGPREIIVHEQTGLLVEPDPEAYCAAMVRLAVDPEETTRMGLENFRRSELYTWDKFVESIDSCFDRFS